MSRTSFNTEDVKSLLSQIVEFSVTLQQEWDKVSNQWSNLKSTWHDEQFNKFEPIFEQILYTYEREIMKCESYIFFLAQQIKIAEQGNNKLIDFVQRVVVGLDVAQKVVGLLGGTPPTPIPPPTAPMSSIEQQITAKKKYESLPLVTRPMNLDEQLGQSLETAKERQIEKRKKEEEIALLSRNTPNTFKGKDND